MKNVSGRLRFKGFLLGIGVIFYTIGSFFDHPLGCSFIALSSLLVPLLFIIGVIFYYIGLIGVIDGIRTYYHQAYICTVHRGKIPEDSRIYYCPSCTTIDCQRCYEAVIKKEGCWNCQENGKDKPEAKLDHEETVKKIKGADKPLKKHKSPKENSSTKCVIKV